MKRKRLARLTLALLASGPLYAQSSPLDVKTGAWGYTVTSTTSMAKGVITPAMLKAMPPDLRAKIVNPAPVTTTGKSCVKESDSIESAMDKISNNMNCARKNVKQTSNTYSADMTCTQKSSGGREKTFSMHVSFEAESPDHVVSTSEINSPYGTTHAVTKSRWLGASCAGIPDPPGAHP